MQKKIISTLAALSVIALAGCSRYAEKKPLADAAPVRVGPSSQDVVLDFTSPRIQLIIDRLPLEQGTMNTADYFRLIDDLKTLSSRTENPKIGDLASEMYESFYKENNAYTKNSVGRFYMESILGEAQPEAQKQLTVIARDLSVTKQRLTTLLDNSVTTFPWPREITHLSQALKSADSYTSWLMKAIPRLNLSPELMRPVTAAIRTEYGRYRPGFAEMATNLEGAKDFAQAVAAVKKAIVKLKVKLPEDQAQLLVKADGMVKQLATMETSQDALTLLISVWRLVPPGSREAVFKPVVPELYDFFQDKSDTSLDCLSAPLCLNPVLEVARRIAILPKITEYGVKKVHDQVEDAAKDYLIKEVRNQAAKLLPQIPMEARENIVVEAEKYQALIATIQSDFPNFARSRATKWAAKEFPQQLRGLEVANVAVKVAGRGKITVKPIQAAGDKVVSSAETIGLSLALAHEFLPAGGDRLKPALVEPILKLLAISGFHQLNGKSFPSLLMPMDGDSGEIFKIGELLKGETSFSVPDQFTASTDFFMDRANAKRGSSIAAQAELLRGIARQVKFHRDWEQNIFDEELTPIQVEDLASEIPKGAVELSVFPKDLIFSLALGDAAALLQNIIRPSSPAFLLMPDGELLWGNRYKEIQEGKVSAIAGLVSFENGKRGNTVKTAEIARYVLALSEFLEATEGIENTKASPLLATDSDGKRIVDQVADARRYLRLFQMGLVNFLVSVAQQKDGTMHGKFTLEGGKLNKIPGPITLEDQALAVRALLAGAHSLDLPIFRWAALDTYYAMNRRFWDRKAQFYTAGLLADGAKARNANLREVTSTLIAINELAPHMSSESRAQWEKISAHWTRALEDF